MTSLNPRTWSPSSAARRARSGLLWSGLRWSGLGWSGPGWSGPGWSGLGAWAGLFVIAAVLVAGCTSDDGDSADDTTPSSDAGQTEAPVLGDPDGTDPLAPLPDDVALPLVFVHGFAGSAQQYESQAMRFVANGYPQDRIVAYEHDGAGLDIEAYTAGLVEFVDDVVNEHGAEQVYLVGHSRGTRVSSSFLENETNAARVAKYVALDGMPCPDGAVPCLAITQETFPGQAHVEVATSPESFEAQYEFLVGDAPEVVEIVAQREPVSLSGRAVEFPANTGRDAQLDLWAINPATGRRDGEQPWASVELGPDGEFGPIEVSTGGHYEWVLSAKDSEVQHHLYLQPYLRDSNFVRLLSSTPDGPTRVNTNTSDAHTSIIVMRMREWYASDHADAPDQRRDVLEVSVHSDTDGEPVDVITDFTGNAAIGLHLHDDAATPGETTLGPLPYFADQPFQTGIDVFIPADESTTVTVTNLPRGDAERPQVLRFPAWPSSRHAVSVVFHDWPIDGAGS